VNAVIEVNEVGKIMDARPLDRFSTGPAVPNRLRHACIRPDLRVAGHTGLGWWYSGESRIFHARVTVPAINAVVFDVMLVTKRDRLLRGNSN
jgi:hypothetical protein